MLLHRGGGLEFKGLIAPELGGHDAVKNSHRGARHKHMTTGFIPINFQGPAWEIEARAAFSKPQQMGHHEGGASTGAAGQGGARSALPHPHHQVSATDYLNEMNVGAGGECRVNLECRAVTLQIHRLNVINGDHNVGIAHTGRPDRKRAASHFQVALGQPVIATRQGGRNGCRIEKGGSHVDADAAVLTQLGNDAPRQGFDLPLTPGNIAIAIGQKAGQAAHAIATHLRFRAIGIEDPHAQLTALPGRQGQDHTVSANPEAAVAEALNTFRGEAVAGIGAGSSPAIKHEEIISQALIFAELEHDGGERSHS